MLEFVALLFSLISFNWIDSNTDVFIQAIHDKIYYEDIETLRKAQEILDKFHNNRQFRYETHRDKILRYAAEIGYTDIFKICPRKDDVRDIVCFSSTATFLLRARSDGIITRSSNCINK
jgi:hypothetical protein